MKHPTRALSPAQWRKVEALLRTPGPKRKASVTLASGLLDATDALAGEARRSAFVERALRRYLRGLVLRQRNAQELALLNANAERLNAESSDALADQAGVDE